MTQEEHDAKMHRIGEIIDKVMYNIVRVKKISEIALGAVKAAEIAKTDETLLIAELLAKYGSQETKELNKESNELIAEAQRLAVELGAPPMMFGDWNAQFGFPARNKKEEEKGA